ncbi:Uncharacterised protein [uncultured archaeon]|nr:Uncharacterised protein [uncultured archaeon]
MISEKCKKWYEEEFGYSLGDAFEMQKGKPADRTNYSDLINSRVPVEGVIPVNPNIDYENSQLVEILARPIIPPRR